MTDKQAGKGSKPRKVDMEKWQKAPYWKKLGRRGKKKREKGDNRGK